jgi:glycosyltransferase involved in cell wall biosynthesis
MPPPPARPAASVILPVYNCLPYLEEAVASVLEQTFTDFELLLLDDGSTDGSLGVLRSFAQRDPRCVVLTRGNRGLVPTLNEGISLARGEILFRMDGDDRSHARRFELQMAYLREHPECVALGTDAFLIDPDGHRLRQFGMPPTHAEIDSTHMEGIGSMIVHPTAALRKAAVVQAGGYRPEYAHAEDFDLFLRLAERGELANLPDPLLDYRQHFASIGHSREAAQLAAKQRATAEACARRGVAVGSRAAGAAAPEPQSSPADVYRKWAWWALSAGNVVTARKHAMKALRSAPLAPENLRLIACVLRGR